MKLADWLHVRGLTPEQLRSMLGVAKRSTVNRYLSHQRVPQPKTLMKIIELTEGAVTLADFMDAEPPDCAAVILDEDDNEKWVFPWSRGDEHHEAALAAVRAEPDAGSRLSNPLALALRTLDGRARMTPRGRFLLDGRPSDARRVVQAANAILEDRGEPPIPYPGTPEGMR